MSSDEKQMSAPPPLSPSAGPAAGPGCVYPGQDELLATARSIASTLTLDPYSKGQESSQSFVNTTATTITTT